VGGRYRVFVGGDTVVASLRGRLKQASRDRILVGDSVTLDVHEDGSITIEGVEPRTSILKRRNPGKSVGVRAVAANIEQIVVVGAARRPEWHPHLIDRFVAVAEANQLTAVIVINKCDLVEDCNESLQPYQLAGYSVLATSVPRRSGLETLRAQLAGRISLFTGPTGVGKSSLLNALQPGLRLRTGEVSERAQVGRHTTVAAEMYPFGNAGFVVDTPGLRDVGLWGLEPQEVEAAFPEIRRTGSECRFHDCRHRGEPGCVVAQAVERGRIAPSRLESFHALLDEAIRAARPWA
jgi:ribosome biogenesis GTPase